MQFCTEQMANEILDAEDRVDQICQQSVLRMVSLTEEDHKNLASDLVKLDKALYWTDFKESFDATLTFISMIKWGVSSRWSFRPNSA